MLELELKKWVAVDFLVQPDHLVGFEDCQTAAGWDREVDYGAAGQYIDRPGHHLGRRVAGSLSAQGWVVEDVALLDRFGSEQPGALVRWRLGAECFRVCRKRRGSSQCSEE